MKRPWYLTLWLIVLVTADLLSIFAFLFGQYQLKTLLPQLPAYLYLILTILSFIELYALYKLWHWHLEGFYILIFTTIIALITNTIYMGLTTAVFGLTGVIILYLVMKPVWGNFK